MADYKQYKKDGIVLTDNIKRTSDGAYIQKGEGSHYAWVEYQKLTGPVDRPVVVLQKRACPVRGAAVTHHCDP